MEGDNKIHFRCPNCQTKHVAKKEQAGKEGKCKNCGSKIVVPSSPNQHIKADKIVEIAEPFYADSIGLVVAIDGQFTNIYEVGIYIASIVTLKMLSYDVEDPVALSDEFNLKWINYVASSYSIDGKHPNKKQIADRLQEKFPTYRELFLRAIEPDKSKDEYEKASVQLMWELFSNSTGKEKPESKNGFIKLVAASGQLLELSIKLFKKL
ncbi:MAG: hypothetical protein ACE5I1_18935 [bacterium]